MADQSTPKRTTDDANGTVPVSRATPRVVMTIRKSRDSDTIEAEATLWSRALSDMILEALFGDADVQR